MRILASILMILMPLSGNAEDAVPLSEVAKVSTAVKLVFVKDLQPFDDPVQYSPEGPPICVDNALGKILKELEKSKVKMQFAPWVGRLGMVALKDKEGHVIGILEVVNWNCTFSISDALLNNGKIVPGKKGIYLQGKSPELAKWMYATIKKRWPKRIQEMQEYHRKTSESSLEDVLFGKEDRQPPGADQPATKPADITPVNDQPSTPTPKNAPR